MCWNICVLALLISVHLSLAQWSGHDSKEDSSSPDHVCKTAYGAEPDYIENEDCAYYWSCEDYSGTLKRCKGTDQFHFQYRMCMNDDDVSCYVQMGKYNHGFNYDEINDSYSRTKTCEISHGLQPNVYDEGCKSYWSCHNYEGTLHECPKGFQFDWGKLDCLLDKEVICEKQMEWYYQYVYQETVHPHSEEGSSEEGSSWSSWSSSSYDHPQVYQGPGSMNAGNQPDRARRHRCDVKYGREPDYTCPTCSNYWLCNDNRGSLEHCPPGFLFDWRMNECVKADQVDCQGQREGRRRIYRVWKGQSPQQSRRVLLAEILQGGPQFARNMGD